ncbi:periplasmic component of efflux system [Vibrio cholerae]|uniref:efflux RND transporter periplasmic adaptor subunit n=1 Tax=Vibrio cholerae TaxID=666 RepID=UPI0011D38D2C|nr:efflux RND transporter periplasmic adaptor subunit [Vibrio cholerae]TXZ20379.1 efflux RND transporter periplasmic adaptor subunit [Vibrio cholerae]GIA15194.1 periplasmic component of efflux system [Vibrio cholerae]
MQFQSKFNIQTWWRKAVTVRLGYVLLSAAVIAAFAFPSLSESNEQQGAKASNAVAAMSVTSAVPKNEIWPVIVNAYGVVTPWQEASISARVGGYQLVEVAVNVGDVVKKGQLLARFDRSLLQAEQAELSANAQLALSNLKRIKALKKGFAISEQDVTQAETQAKITQALLEKNQLQLSYTDVFAPDDGVISARSATLGATIPLGQELFQLIRQQRLEWRGEVTADQFHRVAIGQKVALTLPDGTETIAIVRQKSPSFNTNTRLATIYADIAADSQAVAGMYIAGRIVLGENNAVVVPAKSVIIRDGRNYVLTVSKSDSTATVSQLLVQTGRRLGDEVEIISAIENGKHVVVAGAGFLSDGDVVRIVENAQTGGAE